MRLVGREFHIRLKKLRKERSENLSLEVLVEGKNIGCQRNVFACGFDIDEIIHIVWFRFMEEIASN